MEHKSSKTCGSGVVTLSTVHSRSWEEGVSCLLVPFTSSYARLTRALGMFCVSAFAPGCGVPACDQCSSSQLFKWLSEGSGMEECRCQAYTFNSYKIIMNLNHCVGVAAITWGFSGAHMGLRVLVWYVNR